MSGAYYNEIDPYAAVWLRNLIRAGHIAAGDVDERSIAAVSAADLVGYDQCHFFAGIGGWSLALRLAGWPDDRPVWTGSCPCQPFSAAGKRKGVEDHRHLWPEFRRLISECSPPVVFGEQVASKDGREWLAGVRTDLEALAYAVGAADLCAASVGAPHIRQRLWWVADAGSERRVGLDALLWPEAGGRDAPDLPETAGRCEDGGLADAEHDGRREHGRRLDSAAGAGEGEPREREWLRPDPADGSATRRLADAYGGLSGDGGLQPGGQHGLVAPGAVGWRGDWLPCTDGKARRVEPGTFPLAHGVSNRVGRLRAYGNAIVPQVAAEFIIAFRECEP